MKALKKIAIVILIIPIMLLLVSFLLPSRYEVTRTVSMKAPADAVFAEISTLKTWTNWTAWTKAKYPDMEVSFAGPDSGTGATYSWDGKSTGQGTLVITKSEPGKRIDYDLSFQQGKFKSTGTITIAPAGEAVNVTWSNTGELGSNPINRYFGLMMDRMMGPDFAEGLRNLKEKVEKPRM